MISRRRVLQSMGVCITLPLLESALPKKLAHAQGAASKKRFIGCFFPSGAPMPTAANGDWGYAGTLGGALKPLQELPSLFLASPPALALAITLFSSSFSDRKSVV